MPYSYTPPQQGTLHEYTPKLTAFEFNSSGKTAPNVLLFVGGLFDGLLTVPYLPKLAAHLASIDNGNWVLVQGLLSSSYKGWGQSSLLKDNQEIGKMVEYFRSERGGSREKVVLMGHLTGCQDTMRYISDYAYSKEFKSSMKIDGAIMQAPVSDQEASEVDFGKDKIDSLLEIVDKEYLSQGKKDCMLPPEFEKVSHGCPITAYRFYSLTARKGDDDFFSTYLEDSDLECSFGKVKTPLLALYGSKDEYVPDFVDRQGLMDRWKKVTDGEYWSPLSKVLEGASHNVGPGSDTGAVEDLVSTVGEFIEKV